MTLELNYIASLLLIPAFVLCQTPSDGSLVYSSPPEDSLTTKITRLNVNSPQSDFSPYLVKGKLLFVSGRNRHTGVQYVDRNDNAEITDLYSATKLDPTHFSHIEQIETLNTNYYEGSFCTNKEGDILYYTATDPVSSYLKIYRTENKNGTWSKPEILSFCNDDFSYCHPSLSPNGNFMIFSSNIRKEKKGMDLYRSDFVNGSWQKPFPLSDSINTEATEVFPFISPNSVLYFSSDKKAGYGGLDLYKVDLKSEDIQITHLLYPLNSSSDDFGIWTDSSETTGYFSSNRKKGRKDDIYYFTNTIPDFSKAKTIVSKSSHCYSFVEEKTFSTKDTSNLSYEWDFGDGTKGKGLKTRHCYSKPGKFTVRLTILDKVTGEIFKVETASELTIEKTDKLEIQCADSCFAGEPLLIDPGESFLRDQEITETHWAYGDNRHTVGKAVKHIYKNPGIYMLEMGIVAKERNSDKLFYYKAQKKIIVTKNPIHEK